jgi:hypothetical protein
LDVIRPVAKPAIASPSSQSDSSSKRISTPNISSVIDLTMDLFSQYKKQSNDSTSSTPRVNNHSTSNKDLSLSQRPTISPTISTNNSKQQQQQQQQFATKVPTEKMSTGSFLKEALLTGSSVTPSPKTSSPKMAASPLAVDNMLNKSINSPKTNTNTSTIKPTTTLQSPTNHNQRSSGSHKHSSHRSSTDLTHHRTDQQVRFLLQKDSICSISVLDSTTKNVFIFKPTTIKYNVTCFCFIIIATTNIEWTYTRIYFYS